MALSRKQQDEIIKNKGLRAASARRTATKVIIVLLIGALMVTGGTWGVVALIDANSMKVSVNKGAEGLSLSETPDFEKATTNIKMGGPDKMDAVTYTSFDLDNFILNKNGAHHGSDYVAFSFYLKNVSSTRGLKYSEASVLKATTKDIDSAVRIMIITSAVDSEEYFVDIYAKKDASDNIEYVCYDTDRADHLPIELSALNLKKPGFLSTDLTVPFFGFREVQEDLNYYISYKEDKVLKPLEIVKYTIVIWVEGTDFECKNEINMGACSINVEFNVLEYGEIENY